MSQNPILSQRAKMPLLQRRRPRGLECSSCPAYIAKHFPGKKADEVYKENKDPPKFEAYIDGLNLFEARKNGLAPQEPRARKRARSSGAEAQDEGQSDVEMDEEPEVAVSAQRRRTLKAKTHLGILWPTKV